MEECNVQTKDQLHQRERKYIEELECVNKVLPTRTKKEWRQDNREKDRSISRHYHQTHKEQLSAHYQCPICNGSYRHSNKSIHYKTKKHLTAVALLEYN